METNKIEDTITEDWNQVIGSHTINNSEMKNLENRWHSKRLTIYCATDRGLKKGIGTSSYAFFWLNDTEPIISGSAVEHQPHKSASSTR